MGDGGSGTNVLSREGELARLSGFLAPGASAGGLVLLGDPGVGKTTLWETGLVLAAEGGLAVLSARASEAETQLSFAALADLVDGIDEEVLAALPAPHRRAIEVAVRRVDAQGAPPDALATCAGFLGALRGLAARQPLLVAVDDIQWLDAPSAEVVAFAARRAGAGIRFLLSRRSGRSAELERALEPRGVERLELAGLSAGAIGRLLAERLGLLLPRRVLRQVYETSHGNPLFALELGRLLADGGVPGPGGELPFPHLVEDLFGARVRALAPAARRALLAVALSAGISRPELARIVDPLAVEDALTSGLLVVDRAHVLPSHGLLAAAARHLSAAGERRELHGDLAEAVGDPILRARHLAAATSAADEALAGKLAGAVAAAFEGGRLREAEELGREVLRLTPDRSPARAERVLELARLQLALGELASARALIATHLDEVPRGRQRGRAYFLASLASARTDEFAQLELALAEGGDDAEVRADALSRKALLLSISAVERLDEAEDLAREALLTARSAGPVVERRVLPSLAWSLVLQGRPLDELPPPGARPPGAGLYETSLERPLGVRLAFRGETAEARRILEHLSQEAEERGEAWTVVAMTIQRCELELRRGDVTATELLFEELAEWAPFEDLPFVHARFRAMTGALRGDRTETEGWAARVLQHPEPGSPPAWDRLECVRALGIVALVAGDAEEAAARFRPVWVHTQREHVRDPGAFPVAGDLVEALVQTGDTEAARSVTEQLARDAAEQEHPWGLATVRRCAALLRLRDGGEDSAERELEEAAREYGALGLGFERARCLLALGRARRRAKKSGAARRTLEGAVAQFEQLGCGGWEGLARDELGRIGGRRQSNADELTPSERRVADLAASGLSNKEIAGELFVSVYTVEDHLSNAYAKLGIRSRTQLARVLPPPE